MIPRSSYWLFFILAALSFLLTTNVTGQQLTGQFWHVTDFHWDLNYTHRGGDAKNMCWDANDINSTNEVGVFGNYACDSPWTLVQSCLTFMNRTTPDFIIWTGDDSAHVGDENFSLDKVVTIIKTLTDAIKVYFPNTPVIPVFGNHDAFPKHNFSPNPSDLYDRVAELWKDWIGEGYDQFKQGGYYSMRHPTQPNVTVIGLNTPLYYSKNPLVDPSNDDPAGQLLWLDNVLSNLANTGKKAYIVAHVPPGIFGRKVCPTGYYWFRPDLNRKYLDIIIKYSNVIIGQFYGHDHTDSFKLYYDDQQNPINVHFAAPAVTPWNTTLSGIGPNNPGVRLFTYNTNYGNVLNYEQYYLNLSKANAQKTDNWEREYDFRGAYGLSDMSYSAINNVAQTFATSDRTYFDKYFLYNSVSAAGPQECDDVCKRNHYCSIVKIDYSDFALCNNGNSIFPNIATRFHNNYAYRGPYSSRRRMGSWIVKPQD